MLFIISSGNWRQVGCMSAIEKNHTVKVKMPIQKAFEKHSLIKHIPHKSVREGHTLLTCGSTVKMLLPGLMRGMQWIYDTLIWQCPVLRN